MAGVGAEAWGGPQWETGLEWQVGAEEAGGEGCREEGGGEGSWGSSLPGHLHQSALGIATLTGHFLHAPTLLSWWCRGTHGTPTLYRTMAQGPRLSPPDK